MDNKQRQIGGIQAQLQSENRVFDITIIALERLEQFLNTERKVQTLAQTATGSSRDMHDDSQNAPERESYFLEPALQCNNLYMAARYDDPEVFDIAAESFLKDLLEWYAGRELLDYYDEVDACVIPIIAAITRSSDALASLGCGSVFDVFQKYVMTTPIMKVSSEDGYEQTREGVTAWILGQHYAGKPMDLPEGFIVPHKRGNVLDGYKRLITAMTIMFDNIAPAKVFYQIIKRHLPEVSQQYPDINEAEIEKLYLRKSQGFPVEPKNSNISEISADIYPLLDKAVKDVLAKNNMDFSEINIAINIAIKK